MLTGDIDILGDLTGPVGAINFIMDGGGLALVAGTQGDLQIPTGYTITEANLFGDQTGSIVVDIQKATYAGFPTFASITASEKPTLSTAQKSTNTTLTGWTTDIAAGDILRIIIDSVTTCERVTLSLKVVRA